LLGPVYCVAVPVAMLVFAATLVGCLPATDPAVTTAATAPGDGRRTASGRFPARVTVLIALSTAYYFVYGPFETATPSFVRDRLHADQDTYGLLWTLFGIGAMVTLPLGATLARRRPGLVNAVGAVVWGLIMVSLITAGSTAVAAVLFALGGAVWGPYTVVETSALQRWTDPARHGLVFGLQRALLGTAAPVGAALGAVALPYVASNVVLGVSAGACAGAGACALLHRGLRQAR
jgi:predicted MFS family arabinose efflux permease